MGENTSQKPQDTDADNFGDELFADLAPKESKRRSAMPPPPPPPQPPGGLFKAADSNPRSSAPQVSQSFARSAPPPAPPSIRTTPTRPSLAPPPPSKRGTVPPQATKPPSLPKKTEIGLAPPRLPAETSGEVVAAAVPVEPSAPQSAVAPPTQVEAAYASVTPEAPGAPLASDAAGTLTDPDSGMTGVADEVTPLTSASPPPFAGPEPARNVPAVRQSAAGFADAAVQPATPPPASAVPRSTMISEAPPPIAMESAVAAPPGKGKTIGLWAAIAAVLALGGAALAFSGGSSAGSLVITVEGPGHRPVDKVEIFVDGKLECSQSPCRVAEVKEGVRTVKVNAPGYDRLAEYPITIEGGKDQSERISLTADTTSAQADTAEAAPALAATPGGTAEAPKTPFPAAATPAAAAAEEKAAPADDGAALSLSDLSSTKSQDVEKASVKEPVRPKRRVSSGGNNKIKKITKPTKEESGAEQGTLRLSTIPIAKVILDGKPVGSTPKIIKVSAGKHSIVFISPKGRKSRRVTVDPGESKVVSVRFK